MSSSIQFQQIAELTGGVHGPSARPSSAQADPIEFKRALDQVSAKESLSSQGKSSEESIVKSRNGQALEFSQHALERMRLRGVSFTPDALHRIQAAVDKANEKGSKEALLLTDESALIVSVKNNKVVTVMDKQFMKEHVFTNIDSTVLI